MSEKRLVLGFIPQDCHWVVVSPSGVMIGPRFSNEEPAREFFEEIAETWERNDFDEIDKYNDFDPLD